MASRRLFPTFANKTIFDSIDVMYDWIISCFGDTNVEDFDTTYNPFIICYLPGFVNTLVKDSSYKIRDFNTIASFTNLATPADNWYPVLFMINLGLGDQMDLYSLEYGYFLATFNSKDYYMVPKKFRIVKPRKEVRCQVKLKTSATV